VHKSEVKKSGIASLRKGEAVEFVGTRDGDRRIARIVTGPSGVEVLGGPTGICRHWNLKGNSVSSLCRARMRITLCTSPTWSTRCHGSVVRESNCDLMAEKMAHMGNPSAQKRTNGSP
jgi:hypothetical protein